MRRAGLLGAFVTMLLFLCGNSLRSETVNTVAIPAGDYRPLLRSQNELEKIRVESFRIARRPVTNQDFLAFVQANSAWQKSRARPLFVDSAYLSHWAGDLVLGPHAPATSPVVNVSWFAACAYAKWVGGRLPMTTEWERANTPGFKSEDPATDPTFRAFVLAWLAEPAPEPLPPVGSTPVNFFGVADLNGLVWEWVEDFNSSLVTGESRGDSSLERNLFCGAGSLGARNREDYPAFMRAAFRSSLRANFCIRNLGFRCVYP